MEFSHCSISIFKQVSSALHQLVRATIRNIYWVNTDSLITFYNCLRAHDIIEEIHHSHWCCHDFHRSRLLSLFGRRPVLDFTGFLAIAAPCFIDPFALSCSLHSWLSFPTHTAYIYSSVHLHVFLWNCFCYMFVCTRQAGFPPVIPWLFTKDVYYTTFAQFLWQFRA